MSIYKFYVYAYLREDGTPYYIGKGFDKRAYVKHGKIGVPKNLNRIIFYQTGLLEADVFNLEIKYIKLFGRKDNETGILRNRTAGGEGSSGRKNNHKQLSEEHKLKLSIAAKGKKVTEETKLKMSLARKGKKTGPRGPMSEENKQKLRKPKTEEHKEKLRGLKGPQKNPRKTLSEKHKANMRKPHGPMSAEHKLAMSLAIKEIYKQKLKLKQLSFV